MHFLKMGSRVLISFIVILQWQYEAVIGIQQLQVEIICKSWSSLRIDEGRILFQVVQILVEQQRDQEGDVFLLLKFRYLKT